MCFPCIHSKFSEVWQTVWAKWCCTVNSHYPWQGPQRFARQYRSFFALHCVAVGELLSIIGLGGSLYWCAFVLKVGAESLRLFLNIPHPLLLFLLSIYWLNLYCDLKWSLINNLLNKMLLCRLRVWQKRNSSFARDMLFAELRSQRSRVKCSWVVSSWSDISGTRAHVSCKVANEMIAWEGCLNCSSQDIVVDRTAQ